MPRAAVLPNRNCGWQGGGDGCAPITGGWQGGGGVQRHPWSRARGCNRIHTLHLCHLNCRLTQKGMIGRDDGALDYPVCPTTHVPIHCKASNGAMGLLGVLGVKDGRPSSENYAFFESTQSRDSNNRLSTTGIDFVLNDVKNFADSPKEMLKQAILHHEIVFRNQVLELHRLYWTQKNLMNDLSWRDFGKTVVNQTSNKLTEVGFLMVDSPMMNSTLAQCGNKFKKCMLHHTWERILNHQLPFDEHIKNANIKCSEIQNSFHCKVYSDPDSEKLQLTLGIKNQENNERKCAAGTLYGKESHLSTKDVSNLEEYAEFMSNEDVSLASSYSCQNHMIDTIMSNAHLPALSCGTSCKRMGKEVFNRPSTYPPNNERLQENSSPHIDLAWHGFRGFSVNILTHEPQQTSNDPRSMDLNITLFEDLSEISEKQVNLPLSASSPTILSAILNDPHTNAVSTPPLKETSNKPSEETSDVHQASIRNSTSMCSLAKEADFLTLGYDLHPCDGQATVERIEPAGCAWDCNQVEGNCVIVRSDSEFIADPRGNSKEGITGSLDGDVRANSTESPTLSPGIYQLNDEDAEKSVAFLGCYMQSERKNVSTTSIADEKGCNIHSSINSSNLPQKASTHSEIKQSNSEKIEEDSVSTSPCGILMPVEGTTSVPLEESQNEDRGADRTGQKLDCIDRNKTSNGRNAKVDGQCVLSMSDNVQTSELDFANTEKYSGVQKVITDAGNCVVLHEKLRSINESTDKCFQIKEEHETEMDCHSWRAAESLIHISLQSTASPSDKLVNIGQMEANDRISCQPQKSPDSFESMVLMLTETVHDEYCMPPRLTEEETEKAKCRFKLREGRGLRDFQREILPGLVSLSRHEICEDLHTIAEAVRLHETRYGSRKPSGGNLFTPVRSKRSRLCYVGHRK